MIMTNFDLTKYECNEALSDCNNYINNTLNSSFRTCETFYISNSYSVISELIYNKIGSF